MKRTLLSIILWFFYGISFALSFVSCLILFLLTFPFDPHRKLPNAAMMFFGQSMVRLNPWWKIHHLGLDNLKKGPKGKVYVANHQSFLDMPLIATLPVNLKWVSKKEMFKIPFAGWTMSMSGHISVDRGSKRAALSLQKLIPPIKDGVSVMIFPEGTRSRDGVLKPFKRGAFYTAFENGFTIQPLVVEGTYKLMQPEGWKVTPRGEMYLSLLEPIDSSEFETVEELKDYTYERIKAESERLRELNK